MLKNLNESLRNAYLKAPEKKLFLIIILLAFSLDQISKNLILYSLKLEVLNSIKLTSFLDFTMVWNKGISYGMFQQSNFWGWLILLLISIIITFILFIWLLNNDQKIIDYALALIIAGALGNIIDRALYGAVVDFISFHIFDYYWYVFNIADSLITMGGFLFILSFFSKGQTSAQNQ